MSVLLLNCQDAAVTPPWNRAYSNSVTVLSQTLSHIHRFPENHAEILAKISQRLAEKDDSSVEKIDLEAAIKAVQAFALGTMEVEVKDLETSIDGDTYGLVTTAEDNSEEWVAGQIYLSEKLVVAVEHASDNPDVFKNLQDQDPGLVFKTLLAITFYHEFMHALRYSLFPKHYTPLGRSVGPRDIIQSSKQEVIEAKESGWAVEWMAIGGSLVLHLKKGERLTEARELAYTGVDRDNEEFFQLDNTFLVSFMSAVETADQPLPRLPTLQTAPIERKRSDIFVRPTTTDFFKKVPPQYDQQDHFVRLGLCLRTVIIDGEVKQVYRRVRCGNNVPVANR
ncbi:hypothetical protein K435DRAFT_852295 [Dendrothele bispora CBS 962.96]|uniref:Uncharacterized protein n=1 Tax=Dendrothele bispora (strain CBS 962.96) TaxID=1314807 RepID=A0A4S8MJV5_DENBC|nr:hypothetical protein K435DRAFT_852295 [Dendrothele bispora CBS 962.96]